MALSTVSSLDEAFTAAPAAVPGDGDAIGEDAGHKNQTAQGDAAATKDATMEGPESIVIQNGGSEEGDTAATSAEMQVDTGTDEEPADEAAKNHADEDVDREDKGLDGQEQPDVAEGVIETK